MAANRARHRTRFSLVAIMAASLLPVCAVQAGALLDKANDLYSAGKLKEAIATYRSAALADENPALCYFNSANAFFQLDSLSQALVYYKACLSYAPDFFKGYLNLAVVYYTLDDLGNCIATVRRGLKIEPDHQKAVLILAAAYRKAGAIPQAVVEFERLASRYPELEEPFISLGEIYRDLGDPREAIDWLTRYPQNGKNLAYVYSLLADLTESNGDLARALYYNQQVLDLEPKKKWALYRIVALHEKMGNDLVAYEIARQGMDQFPDFPDIALAAGNIAFRQQRLGEAEYCYEAAHRLGSAGAVVGLENIRTVRKEAAGVDQPGP